MNTHSTNRSGSGQLPTFSVADALDAHIASLEKPREYDGLWHPSSISGCHRKAIYEIRQTEPTDPLNAAQRRNFHIGHTWHERFQSAVAASPYVAEVYTEVKVLGEELGITGAGDQVVLFVDGSAELEEFKTIAEWGFKRLKEPKSDHLEQTKPYVYLLREYGGVDQDGKQVPPLGDRLNRVRFTYIEKQRLDTREFVVEWQPEWEQDIRDRIASLDAYRADPISLPPRMAMNGNKKSWMCDWGWGRCPFYTRCWDLDPAEVEPDPDIY